MSCLNHRKHDDHDVLRRKRRVQRREAPKRRDRRVRRGE